MASWLSSGSFQAQETSASRKLVERAGESSGVVTIHGWMDGTDGDF